VLILGRRCGERLRLRLRVAGVDVWVGVNEMTGNTVRLMVDAPRKIVEVTREELLPPAERWRGPGGEGAR
jgi:sRNA-binding carbon storage regulator CsrA